MKGYSVWARTAVTVSAIFSLYTNAAKALSLLRPRPSDYWQAAAVVSSQRVNLDRRSAVTAAFIGPIIGAACSSYPREAAAQQEAGDTNDEFESSYYLPSRAITLVHLSSAKDRAGLELADETIGTPARNVVAVRSVRPDGVAIRKGVQPGMILIDFPDAPSVVSRIRNGPYPIDLRFYNLAAGGDAIGMEGRPIVTADDALKMAKRASEEGDLGSGGGGAATQPRQAANDPSGGGVSSSGFVNKVVKMAEGKCGIHSRRGDVLEIRYEARVGDEVGRIYDSSDWRGTGQPYMFNLGNGDVIKGVDLGTYDMCPGEVRELSIPPQLGYGRRGSKLFDIPADSRLWWRIELVALNFVREGQNDLERDQLYDGGSGELPVYR